MDRSSSVIVKGMKSAKKVRGRRYNQKPPQPFEDKKIVLNIRHGLLRDIVSEVPADSI